MNPGKTLSGNTMRALFALALIFCLAQVSARQNTFLSIVKSTPAVHRPGWPPHLLVTLEDWGLHGPVLEIVATQEGALNGHETLKFDGQGRLLFRGMVTPYLASEDHYSYKDGRLVDTLTLYENGEVVRSKYEYDARGYLTSETDILTTDVEKLEKYRARYFPDAIDLNRKFVEEARAAKPAVREMIYEYGSAGLIKSERCVRKAADATCPAEYTEYGPETEKTVNERDPGRAQYIYDRHRNWTLREEPADSAVVPTTSRRKIRYLDPANQ
jgi:YD repeat-containing protein